MHHLIQRTLTITEVCELLQKKQQVIERMARQKLIPAFKIGVAWRFDPVDLDAWIQAQKEVK
jgi:excisionase family DNA binding protein